MSVVESAGVVAGKRCARCHNVKPADAFYVRGRGGWLSSYCRPCHARNSAESYARTRGPGSPRAHLRLVKPPPRERGQQSQQASTGALHVFREEIATCVCGAFQRHHRNNGAGGCAATNCPEYFERGL